MKWRVLLVIILSVYVQAQQPQGAQYNTTQPTPANGAISAIQTDAAANLFMFPGVQFLAGTALTSASALNTLQYPSGTSTPDRLDVPSSLLIQLDQTSTITGGAVTFQGTYDNINWITIPVTQVVNPQTFASLTNPYTLVASTNQAFMVLPQGFLGIRLNLTTQISGTGTVTPYWTKIAIEPFPAMAPVDVTQWDGANITSQPVAIGTGTPSGNAPAVNASIYVGVAPVSGTAPVPISATTAANSNTNAITVTVSLPTAILSGQQAVTASATALATNTLAKGIVVEAKSTNAISVYVGATGVTTSTGLELPPGASATFQVTNSNAIFVVAATTGATVTWAGN